MVLFSDQLKFFLSQIGNDKYTANGVRIHTNLRAEGFCDLSKRLGHTVYLLYQKLHQIVEIVIDCLLFFQKK